MEKLQEFSFQARLEQYRQLLETQRTLIHSVGNFGLHALKGIFLLNSGGAVAVLAHTKAMQTANGGVHSVIYFAFGACIAVVATGTAYLSELIASWYYQRTSNAAIKREEDTSCASKAIRISSVIFLAFSVILFITSCYLFFKQVIGLEALFSQLQSG